MPASLSTSPKNVVLAARDEDDVATGPGARHLRLVGLPAVGGQDELEVGVALAGQLAQREVELVRAHGGRAGR